MHMKQAASIGFLSALDAMVYTMVSANGQGQGTAIELSIPCHAG